MDKNAEGKKRILITVTEEPYTELRKLLKEAGLKPGYLSEQFDFLIQALLPATRQLIIDARMKKQMTIQDMTEKYGKISKKEMKKHSKK